ncbi:Membrane progestin receptor gamma-B [Acipenser ruthenus]|uniref:Membrane progestin receptor gamma-B n=1 Tax=Acipenser ruthenus TaxID=7906 RepID=A0A444V034_ACIRT|nr:Membrane progestin receptor gamma-B [Acipenser ruthenus]
MGHSHQLFHICAVVGTHFQMEAILADMSSRRGWLAAHTPMPSFLGSVGAVSIGVVLNLAIIGLFSATLLWTPSTAHSPCPCNNNNNNHHQPERKDKYFLWQFCVLCSTLDFWSECYSWPLLVYMLLICLYPFTSSCAHTFSSMSAEARHVCYFFDYGALSLYSLGELPSLSTQTTLQSALYHLSTTLGQSR